MKEAVLSHSRSEHSGVTVALEELVRLKGEARGFSFLPRQPVTSLLAGRHASRLRGRGLAFEELRRYQQGDDIRSMDWKATARLGEPYVRVFTEERERPVLLVVDQRRPMFFGSRRAMKSVTAAELAAVGAWRSLSAGDRVGGMVFNEHELVNLPPHRSQGRVLRFLHELTRLNQELADRNDPGGEDSVTLNTVLEAVSHRAVHDYLVVLISDFDGADETTQRLVSEISAHNDMLAVLVYDPLGASLQGYPGMVAFDRGRAHEVEPGAAFSESFQAVFSSLLDRWTDIFRALRVPLIPVSAAEPPLEQLRNLFGAHLQRRDGRT